MEGNCAAQIAASPSAIEPFKDLLLSPRKLHQLLSSKIVTQLFTLTERQTELARSPYLELVVDYVLRSPARPIKLSALATIEELSYSAECISLMCQHNLIAQLTEDVSSPDPEIQYYALQVSIIFLVGQTGFVCFGPSASNLYFKI